MILRPLLLAVPFLLAPGVARGGDAADQVRRLTPAEKQQILDQADEKSADAALNSALGGGNARQVHGELGAVVGTGGTAGVYGTALVPLGQNASAVISFQDFRSNGFRRRR